MIIDFHTHVFPDKVARKAIPKLSGDAGVKAWSDGTVDGLLCSMRRAGIAQSVTLPVATTPSAVASINRYALSLLNIPGIIPFGAAHPLYEDNEGEMARLKEAGIRGIKLHPDYQEAYIDDPAMVRILEIARFLDLIVVIHSGVDYAFDKVCCTPTRLLNALRKVPHDKIVAAHYGGNECLEEVKQLLFGAGIYIDTSFTHNRPGLREACRELLLGYDVERILFATDSPWDDQLEDVAFIRSLPLDRRRENQIFSENARRLLSLGEPA